MSMKVELSKDGKNLIITIPANTKNPSLSSTGKTLSVASSHGNIETECKVLGQNVRVGVNAYIYATPKE